MQNDSLQDFDLQRFIDAQNPQYDKVINELTNGKKVSHWIWYIFPQVQGLGFSSMSQFYGIAGLDEAIAYLHHPILGQRLYECCQILLTHTGKTAEQIFGSIDSIKLKSSMTLFNVAYQQSPLANQANIFSQVLA